MTWTGVQGSFASWLIAKVVIDPSSPWIIVTESNQAQARLLAELNYFSDGKSAPRIWSFPDREVLPYDHFSPATEIVSERLRTLNAMRQGQARVTLVSAPALCERLPPTPFLDQETLVLSVGETLPLASFRARLIEAGYQETSLVRAPGEFAIRGSLLDVFTVAANYPYRIDFLDETIETLRRFDPETQLSIERVESVSWLPAREFRLDENSIRRFRQSLRERFEGPPQNYGVYREVSRGASIEGLEAYLPLLFEKTAILLDFLPAQPRLIWAPGARDALLETLGQIASRYAHRQGALDFPPLSISEAYTGSDELLQRLNQLQCISLQSSPESTSVGPVHCWGTEPVPDSLKIPRSQQDHLGRHLWNYLSLTHLRGFLVAGSSGRQDSLFPLFTQADLLPPRKNEDWDTFLACETPWTLNQAPLEEGFLWPEQGVAVLTENEFWMAPPVRRSDATAGKNPLVLIQDFKNLLPAAPVIHVEHGIGRYRGLVHLEVDGIPGDFLHLEYLGGDRLYVPIGSLHLVSRYLGGDADQAPWHRLGGGQWEKTKREAQKRAFDVATELLETHARRKLANAPALTFDPARYERFALECPFEETEDQLTTINQVLADLALTKPMDRVVCGDVGFGKTEVALRAACACVQSGHQAVILVPTTLLAQQHGESFRDRFSNWPVAIDTLSRFRSAREEENIRERLLQGKIDIVIGTHKLLQNTPRFKNLGLLIIDEEHRFGVRQKEQISRLKADIHTLTLTATPIPRTLNMTLGGLRDLSLIATPPKDRLPIQTFLGPWDLTIVQEAIARELQRGGQVYVVTPRVQGIEALTQEMARLAPHHEVRYAHGQMPERQLEQTMVDFYHQRFAILVATKIIESGINVPLANTILINQADRFGLAELHQLRGRVGRSHHRAYAYLFVDSYESLGADTQQRLEALTRFDALGSGFLLAMQDLEIRGAGELLGKAQSGEIESIGFSLYAEYVQKAVAYLKSGQDPALGLESLELDPDRAEVDLQAPALIPDSYVSDIHQRLVLYKELAFKTSPEALEAFRNELSDRFGPCPEPLETLLTVSRLRLAVAPLGIRKLEAHAAGGRILFASQTPIRPNDLVSLIEMEPVHYRFDGSNRLLYRKPMHEIEDRLHWIQQILTILGSPPPTP
ncbi:MAG: transcription-repair coupling factor [Gammaproteobacteria bacterium]